MNRFLLVGLLTAAAALPAFGQAPPGIRPVSVLSRGVDLSKYGKLTVLVTLDHNSRESNRLDAVRVLEDLFLECLLAKGYTIVARSDINKLLQERNLQESGVTDGVASNVGKVLNVPAVLVVHITELSAGYKGETLRATIGARLVDVETGNILWSGSHKGSGSNAWGAGAALVNIGSALAESFPPMPIRAEMRTPPKESPRPETEPMSENPPAEKPPADGPPAESEKKDLPKTELRDLSKAPVQEPPLPMVKKAAGKLAVINIRAGNEWWSNEILDRRVEDIFVNVLLSKGFQLVSRSDMRAILKEQQFQASGITEENAVAVGKILNVRAILLFGVTVADVEVTYPSSKKRVTQGRAAIGAKLLDVQTGQIVWAHSDFQVMTLPDEESFADLQDTVSTRVALCLPPYPNPQRALLEVASIQRAMGQITAAKGNYQNIVQMFPKSPEAKVATTQLRLLK